MCTPINLMDGARMGMGKVICWSALKMRKRITDELQQQTSITNKHYRTDVASFPFTTDDNRYNQANAHTVLHIDSLLVAHFH